MFGGLIAMARRQKMFEPVAEPPFRDWRNRDRRWDEEFVSHTIEINGCKLRRAAERGAHTAPLDDDVSPCAADYGLDPICLAWGSNH